MGRAPRLTLLAAALCGCDTYHYLSGVFNENARRPVQALKHYEAFLASRPKDPRSCEVRLRAAELYRGLFERCEEARRHYEAAARASPRQKACVDRAKEGLMRCPDYFPLDPGRSWVFVDSASGGKAMRLEWEARPDTSPSAGVFLESLYAGDRRIRQGAQRYERSDWALWRVDEGGREPILRYPYSEGMAWSVRRGSRRVEYLIVSAAASVQSRAGSFSDCLKVRELDLSFPAAWRYDYYCPGVGRVKITIGGRGYENPNAELLRYSKIN